MSAEQTPEDSPQPSPVPSPLPEPEQLATEDRTEVDIVEEEDNEEEEEELDEEEEECINEDHLCNICNEKLKNPRVLYCLHVFCGECLQKQLEPSTPDEGAMTGAAIICTICGQDTRLESKGIDEILPDYVMVNTLDMEAILKMQIICTSCKAKEKAVARCSDCANFLCPNCVTAHQYMRCFEDHKVVSFEEMRSKEGFSLHKPLFCQIHPAEGLKYFCVTCQVPVCTECMVTEHRHPEHESRRLTDMEETSKSAIQSLVTEAKSKMQFCEEASYSLENSLSELQMQRDNAKGLIVEMFQSYKAMLENRKDEILAELEDIHSTQEDTIMHVFHNVGKTIEKIEDGCKFANRILNNGNCTEILLMKRLITRQLLTLVNNTAVPEVNVQIHFQTDPAKFEENVKAMFGSFHKDKEIKETSVPSLQSSFESEGMPGPSGLLSPNTSEFIPSMQALPPLSLDTQAPSMPHVSALSGVSPQTINSIASSIQSLASGVQPATVVERSSSRNSYSPAMSDSGISVDAGSNSSNPNQPKVNVAALAKLGTVNVNTQGQITLNGQVIPGLTVNNVSGLSLLPQGVPNRAPTPTTPMTPMTPDPGNIHGLANIMGTVPGGTPPVSQCPTPPKLADIAELLNQPSGFPTGISNILGNVSVAQCPTTRLADITELLNQTPGLSTGVGLPGGIGGTPGLTPSPHSAFNMHSLPPPFPPRNPAKVSAMQISCKFGQLGPGKGQFNSPHGFCLGIDEDIVVADTNNHRIQVFEKKGDFKYQFGIPGRDEGQLWYPRKVAVIRYSGKYVVCDRGNERSRMQIFTKNGHFLKKIAIRYIDIVAGLAITRAGHIVAVDSVSPTVFVIGETGELIKWFDCSDYMREPSDIAVNAKEYFVCDFKGHCVVVFNEEGQFMRRIGCENITNFPNGIDVSDAGDVLIGDSHGNRFHVAVFQRDGSLLREFECPYVKVSRCCGLKITFEGYVVTLAKNNHHVLVLNTLYIT